VGDVTKILQERLSLKDITDTNLPRIAIEQALSAYPDIPFITADISKDEIFPSSTSSFHPTHWTTLRIPWKY